MRDQKKPAGSSAIIPGRPRRIDPTVPLFDPGLQDAATLYWRVMISANVVLWRERHGYTREKMARQAGVSLAHMTDIECGMHDALPYRLWCIAAALDMSAEELLAPTQRFHLPDIRSPMAR